MLVNNGAQALRDFSEKLDKETVVQVTGGVWFGFGLGLSNAVFIEGETGVILIDTLDSLERGTKLSEIIQKCTNKEVKTILYTRSHPDHTGGAGAFAGSKPEVIRLCPGEAAPGAVSAAPGGPEPACHPAVWLFPQR